ncbi:MAG: hypothetical protein HQK72_17665 [Desulfamplus sp.]|nr:hypothetical protein [Desulfamplus sp.]
MYKNLIPFLITYISGFATAFVVIMLLNRTAILKHQSITKLTDMIFNITNKKNIYNNDAIDNIDTDLMLSQSNQTQINTPEILNSVIERTLILKHHVQSFTQKIGGNTDNAINKFAELLSSINSSIKGTTDVVETVRSRMSSCIAGNEKITDTALTVIKERYQVMINEVMQQFDLTIQRKKEDIAKLDHIKESAYRIKPFADDISSIASTTKLLSLNAFIEAARAGQHGKAFGVVALEVRQLADKSRNSAEDMDKSLNEIVEFIDNSIKELKSAIDVESKFIQSTMILLQDVVMSVVESFISISEAVEKTIGDSSTFRDEVNDIVFNLQFEDICHQMSNNILNILNTIGCDIEAVIPEEYRIKERILDDTGTPLVSFECSGNSIEESSADDDVTFF